MTALTPLEIERRRRISVALWAYAYEICDDPIVSDAKFDRVCDEIDLDISTGNVKMDRWFKKNFKPWTGTWVWRHPELHKLRILYLNYQEYSKYTDNKNRPLSRYLLGRESLDG